jgi:hypothetical protein
VALGDSFLSVGAVPQGDAVPFVVTHECTMANLSIVRGVLLDFFVKDASSDSGSPSMGSRRTIFSLPLCLSACFTNNRVS